MDWILLHHGMGVNVRSALAAGQQTYAETGLQPDLISVYHLLGDPATKIR